MFAGNIELQILVNVDTQDGGPELITVAYCQSHHYFYRSVLV
jgi:hypothetical protein